MGILNLTFNFSLGRKKRNAPEEHIEQRALILQKIEKTLPYLLSLPKGISGHDCILKSICEAARTPNHQDGLLGDFINLMLVPHHTMDLISSNHNESDYLEAQRAGHFLEDCSKYSLKCPISFFEVKNFKVKPRFTGQ